MKRMHFSYFCALSLILMLAGVEVSLARAPATAKIAFSSSRDGAWDIYLMNPDGTEPVGLTHLDGNNYHPTWSPTGRHILFTSDRDGFLDLYLMDARGRNVRRVFRQWDVRQHPAWAPDGRRIVYVRGSKKDKKVPQFYIASINGTGEKRIADGSFPVWAPDGTEIAFVSEKGEIRVINVETREEETIAPMEGAMAMDLAWSPDGAQIAFTRLDIFDFLLDKAREARDAPEVKKGDKQAGVVKGDGKAADIQSALYSINRDGSGLKRLVVLDGTKTSDPAWSPRGSELIYQQTIGEELHLFKIDLGGGVPVQLTAAGSNFDAAWFDPAALPVVPQPRLLITVWGKLKL